MQSWSSAGLHLGRHAEGNAPKQESSKRPGPGHEAPALHAKRKQEECAWRTSVKTEAAGNPKVKASSKVEAEGSINTLSTACLDICGLLFRCVGRRVFHDGAETLVAAQTWHTLTLDAANIAANLARCFSTFGRAGAFFETTDPVKFDRLRVCLCTAH